LKDQKSFALSHISVLTLDFPNALHILKISLFFLPSYAAQQVNSQFNTDVTLLYLSILDNSSCHIEAFKEKLSILYL
jgi:hypothetical protein